MNNKITFIGAGNMGGAMIRGLINASFFNPEDITATSKTQGTRQILRDELGIETSGHNNEAVKEADVVVLAVKPYLITEVITEIKASLKPNVIIISIATGFTLDDFTNLLGAKTKFVRAMPNTPVQVGLGASGIVPNNNLTPADKQYILNLFKTFGEAEMVSELQLNAVTGVSGSSPTLIYMIIEAMADAAVQQGLSRAQGLKLAAQTVKGAAEMVLQTGKHPGELKDMVCTPGGTSIEVVRTAEQLGLRTTIIESIIAGAEKGAILNNKN